MHLNVMAKEVPMIANEWKRETTQVVEDLIYRIPDRAPKKVEFKYFEKLPEAVAKYLRLVLKEGQPVINAVRLTQSGRFRAGLWSSFQAEQYFSIDPPAFVWDAGIRMAGIIPVKVRDAYLEGKGSTLAKIFGIFPFIHQRSVVEISIGALQRYLAESAWFPTALLPSDRLVWNELDAYSAVAKITDRGIEASLEFHFNEAGEIENVFAPGRYRYADGKFLFTPWAGCFKNYRQIHGMRIPMEAEVAWVLPEGRFSYFKGQIKEIEFNGDVFHRFAPTCACEVH
jgi:Family of unknown function (DUF6920)